MNPKHKKHVLLSSFKGQRLWFSNKKEMEEMPSNGELRDKNHCWSKQKEKLTKARLKFTTKHPDDPLDFLGKV